MTDIFHKLMGETFGQMSARRKKRPAEFGESAGHPFRGNQWKDGETGPQVDIYDAKFQVATLSGFDAKEQGRIMSMAEKKLGVTYEEGRSNLAKLMDDAKKNGSWEEGMHWYGDAHTLSAQIGDANGLPTSNVIGAFAAMSPGHTWEREEPIVRAMAEYTDRSLTISDTRLATLNAALEAQGLNAVKNGDRFENMDTRTGVFAMKRQFDEESRGSWGVPYGYGNFEKALQCMRGENPDDVLGGVKIRSFYNNINDPTDSRDVTIDVQMVQAYADDNRLQNDSKTMNAPSIQGVQVGITPVLADAIREIAAEHNILPQQAQAIMWVEYRKQNPITEKRD